MKLPTQQQLTAEQKTPISAPMTQSMIVTGPPGSGKTVVAIYRMRQARKVDPDRTVTAITLSRLLAHYWMTKCKKRRRVLTTRGFVTTGKNAREAIHERSDRMNTTYHQ